MKVVLIRDRHSRSERLVKILQQIPEIEVVMQSVKASEALELCGLHNPDLLIMDVFSKEISGFQYAVHIKQNFPSIKVFIMTGVKDHGLTQKAKQAGMDIVARRNISLQEFKQLIRYSQKHYRVFPIAGPDHQEPL